jgi:hypothetical protein
VRFWGGRRSVRERERDSYASTWGEWAKIRMMMRERFGWVKQCGEAEIFESVFAGRWTDERIYDLVADPLADFVYQSVGTVWEFGNTILLLVSAHNGILVQVHAAHSVSEERGGVVEDLVTASGTLHFTGNTLAAAISGDFHEGESSVDVVDAVEDAGEETTILDGIVVGRAAGTSPSFVLSTAEER